MIKNFDYIVYVLTNHIKLTGYTTNIVYNVLDPTNS